MWRHRNRLQCSLTITTKIATATATEDVGSHALSTSIRTRIRSLCSCVRVRLLAQLAGPLAPDGAPPEGAQVLAAGVVGLADRLLDHLGEDVGHGDAPVPARSAPGTAECTCTTSTHRIAPIPSCMLTNCRYISLCRVGDSPSSFFPPLTTAPPASPGLREASFFRKTSLPKTSLPPVAILLPTH